MSRDTSGHTTDGHTTVQYAAPYLALSPIEIDTSGQILASRLPLMRNSHSLQ